MRGTRRSTSSPASGCTSRRATASASGSGMRVTVCELPHETRALAAAWQDLCAHTVAQSAELVLLPEFAMVAPVWASPRFDAACWSAAEILGERQLRRLPELGAAF